MNHKELQEAVEKTRSNLECMEHVSDERLIQAWAKFNRFGNVVAMDRESMVVIHRLRQLSIGMAQKAVKTAEEALKQFEYDTLHGETDIEKP